MSIKNLNNSPKQAGFTLVELMISLSVFATILLLSSVVLIRLGSIFSKGTNQANTQNVARTLVDTISSELAFGGTAPRQYLNGGPMPIPANPGTTSVICFGTSRYTFVTNHRVSGAAIDHGLWRDTMTSGNSCQANQQFLVSANPQDSLSVAGSGSELLPEGMRVTQLLLTTNATSYAITISIAYGDNGGLDGGPNDLVGFMAGPPANTFCKGTTGDQYCAIATLSKTVSRRI